VFRGAPTSVHGHPIDAAVHAVLADIRARTHILRDRGALAVLAVYDPLSATRMTYEQYVPKIQGPALAWLDHGEPGSDPAIPLATVSLAAFERILGDSASAVWAHLLRGEIDRPVLGASASLRIRSSIRDITARNVLGVLRGSDPQLASEIVLFTAHSDHLGIGLPVDGDRIYHGALDNASGCAGLLEIVRAFRAMSPPPRRSIVFATVTAEEKGLLGSDYFAHHPTVPLGQIVGNVNLDGVQVIYSPHDIVPIGAEHSTLGKAAEAAARATGFALSPDPSPELVVFIRSDQYSFVRRGIPSVFPQTGYLDEQGRRDRNRALADQWSAKHYHQPSDQWRPEYNAQWGAHELQFDFLLGLAVANDDDRPRWNPGDSFGAQTVGR
jgi:hypothetical protein